MTKSTQQTSKTTTTKRTAKEQRARDAAHELLGIADHEKVDAEIDAMIAEKAHREAVTRSDQGRLMIAALATELTSQPGDVLAIAERFGVEVFETDLGDEPTLGRVDDGINPVRHLLYVRASTSNLDVARAVVGAVARMAGVVFPAELAEATARKMSAARPARLTKGAA